MEYNGVSSEAVTTGETSGAYSATSIVGASVDGIPSGYGSSGIVLGQSSGTKNI